MNISLENADLLLDSQSTIKCLAESTSIDFHHFSLPASLRKAIDVLGFSQATPIQAKALPLLLAGQDLIGIAQTGTGKTAAFGLPALVHIDMDIAQVQALILTPTRELALQVSQALADFGQFISNFSIATVYGGASYTPQIEALEQGAQLVVGTPGRIRDLLAKNKIDLGKVKFFVLDEADEMLSMGFEEEVAQIVQSLPSKRQTALFSATMKPQVENIAQKYISDPQTVYIAAHTSTVETVKQIYAVVANRSKMKALVRVLSTTTAEAAIVFVRTRSNAEDVAIELCSHGIQAAALSGDVPQRDREKIVERLRNGSLNVLVATDVAARGIDVERIGIVVNYDVPREVESYIHRIGRTGRAGREGVSITFFTPKEQHRIKQIERTTKARLEAITIPTAKDVNKYKADRVLEKLPDRLAAGNLDIYVQAIDKIWADEFALVDIAAGLLALAVGDKGPNIGETIDEIVEQVSFHDSVKGRGKTIRTKAGRSEVGLRYRIEVGHKDNVQPGSIVGAITGEAGLRGSDIGQIEIYPTFTIVDIYVPITSAQIAKLTYAQINNRQIRLSLDKGPKHRGVTKRTTERASKRGKTFKTKKADSTVRKNKSKIGRKKKR